MLTLTKLPNRVDAAECTIAEFEGLISLLDHALWRCYKDGTEIPDAFAEVAHYYGAIGQR